MSIFPVTRLRGDGEIPTVIGRYDSAKAGNLPIYGPAQARALHVAGPPPGIHGAIEPTDRAGGEGVVALNAIFAQQVCVENMARSLGGKEVWKK